MMPKGGYLEKKLMFTVLVLLYCAVLYVHHWRYESGKGN